MDPERKERDELLEKMFKNLVKIDFIPTYEKLNVEKLYNDIKNEIESLL